MTQEADAIREIAKGLEADMARLGVLAGARFAGRVMDLFAIADEVDQAIEGMATVMDEQAAELAVRDEEAA